VEGALVVNIGSLLSDWTNGKLLATLHRVVSLGESKPRTSLAFFADPDQEVSTSLKSKETSQDDSSKQGMSIAEYIQLRSGGSGRQRSGLAFTVGDEKRAKEAKNN
jgi:isopenicillin N synthase-like dioxygenase